MCITVNSNQKKLPGGQQEQGHGVVHLNQEEHYQKHTIDGKISKYVIYNKSRLGLIDDNKNKDHFT